MQFRDVLAEMETGRPFALEWVSCDARRRRGGELRFAEGLRLLVQEEGHAGMPRKARPAGNAYDRSAQYVNLWHEASGRYYRVYKRLMLAFDGKEIAY